MLFMTMTAATPETIIEIVDDVFLPLANESQLGHGEFRRNSARGAEDLDREDQRVAFLDPCLGLTVGVAIGRGHCDTDGGLDLLSCDGLLKARDDSVEREVNRGAPLVGAVEHTAVASVDAHVADRNFGRGCDD